MRSHYDVTDKATFCLAGLEIFNINAAWRARPPSRAKYKTRPIKNLETLFTLNIQF